MAADINPNRNCLSHIAVALLTFAAVIAPSRAWAADATPTWERPPGWSLTRGGEGGRTIVVTTLARAGAGSFAAALAADGPRTIVFAVGGIIDLGGESLV